MDEGIFKFLLMVGVIVLSAIFNYLKKGKDNDDVDSSSESVIQQDRRRPAQQPHMPERSLFPHEYASHPSQAHRPMPQNPTPAKPGPQRGYAPARAQQQLPEEGVRVTSAKPMAPVQTKKENKMFKNKDDLRRAIILGEVLAPKF